MILKNGTLDAHLYAQVCCVEKWPDCPGTAVRGDSVVPQYDASSEAGPLARTFVR